MDYDQLKKDVAEIVSITKDVPEALQARCFELLLQNLLGGVKPKPNPPVKKKEDENNEEVDDNREERGGAISIPGPVKAFMRRTGVEDREINAIAMIEGGVFHFIKEPNHDNAARGQNEWALLLALKNAVMGNAFTVDPEDVRSVVQDKGFYSRSNFASYFKKPAYAYYKDAMEPQGPPRGLSREGETALAALVKALANT